MDKPMLMFKRFGHQVHLMVQKEAKRCGIEFMGGPQGQVLRFLDHCEQKEELVLGPGEGIVFFLLRDGIGAIICQVAFFFAFH